MSTQKPSSNLPKGAPKPPDLPRGYNKWQPMGWGWNTKGKPVGSPWACFVTSMPDYGWLTSEKKLNGKNESTSGNVGAFYIRAVKAPTVAKRAKVRPVAKPATNSAKIERALAIVAESRPRMNELTREQRTELEASARASIARAKKAPAVTPAKPIKAVRMWTDPATFASVPAFSTKRAFPEDHLYAILDVTDEAALIELVAKAICKSEGLKWRLQKSPMTSGNGSNQQQSFRDAAEAALASIGVIAKRKSK